MSEKEVIDHFEKLLINQLKLMIPQTKFGSISSGGIDSTLQSYLLDRISKPENFVTLNFGKEKDPIMKKIHFFDKFFSKSISQIEVKKNLYKKIALKCYEVISSPLFTHDLPGRFILSDFFTEIADITFA